MKSELTIFTDGASSGNPGPGYAMFVIQKEKNNPKTTISQRVALDYCTNNEAEYLAVVHALRYLLQNNACTVDHSSVLFKIDSMLVVEQLAGRWKIREQRMRDFVGTIHSLRLQLPIPALFTHIPREENLADALKYDA